MKTTVNIDDSVVERAKREATRRGITMSALAEAGLRRILEETDSKPNPIRRKRPTWRSGGSMFDVSDRNALCDVPD